jgi:hypothetical protein
MINTIKLHGLVVFFIKKSKRKKELTMKNKRIQLTIPSPPGALYFNRVNRQCRKVLPTLVDRIKEMFNYAG